jgi:hypothetical protein
MCHGACFQPTSKFKLERMRLSLAPAAGLEASKIACLSGVSSPYRFHHEFHQPTEGRAGATAVHAGGVYAVKSDWILLGGGSGNEEGGRVRSAAQGGAGISDRSWLSVDI